MWKANGKSGPLAAQFGSMVSIGLHIRKPRKFKFLASVNAVEMWRCGCSERLFQCFSNMGISLTKAGGRGVVDRLRAGYDKEILLWKEEIASKLQPAQNAVSNVARQLFSDTCNIQFDSDSWSSDADTSFEEMTLQCGLDVDTGHGGRSGDTGYGTTAGYTGPSGDIGHGTTVGYTGPSGDIGHGSTVGYTGPSGDIGHGSTVGYTGPSGDIDHGSTVGYTGPSGDIGHGSTVGYAGPSGDIGHGSTVGYTGPSGDIGHGSTVGYTGPSGDIGHGSTVGYTCPSGDIGHGSTVGYTGPSGDIGHGSTVGYTGPSGDIGHGSTVGYTGPSGDIGHGSTVSYTGPSGDISHGYTVGYTGPSGDISHGSTVGYTGPSGDIGHGSTVGYTGPSGDIGHGSTVGYTGPSGDIGHGSTVSYTGPSGDIGHGSTVSYTDPSGDIGHGSTVGYTGPSCDIGHGSTVGYTGPSGDIGHGSTVGYTGTSGDIGHGSTVGYTGPSGDIGHGSTVGYTGPSGDIGHGSTAGYTGPSGTGCDIDIIEMEISETSQVRKNPGYSLAWDNVQIQSTAHYQSTTNQNKMLMWANAYAAKNRISYSHEEDKTTVSAKDLSFQIYIPSQRMIDSHRKRMKTIVSRIICENLSHFNKYYSDCVEVHIEHEYSEESAKRSELVNLGVIQENPSSLSGVIAILDHLYTYVPVNGDQTHVLMCHGDGLSVERHIDAHRTRAGCTTTKGRLQGLEPVSQEFHKRGIILQDIMNEFFLGKSASNRGTLTHIKNKFRHRNVKKKVMDSFNHVANFLSFVTSGLVCLLVMKKLGLSSLKGKPGNSVYNGTIEERTEFLDQLANEVVDEVWLMKDTSVLEDIVTGTGSDAGGDGCFNATGDNDVGDDSGIHEEEEEEEEDYPYCLCGEDIGGMMVECCNGGCGNGDWFHLKCVELTEHTVPADDADWFCSETCSAQKLPRTTASCCCKNRNHDHVQTYTCALLWRCLSDLTRRDAIRENDGEAMLDHWTFDMLDFWERNHNKYMILGHRLIAGVHGWLPKRLAHDLVWNRTINIHGGAGRNIGMDLGTEFLNNEFKGDYITLTEAD
ncbi:uncharacterized protein LOC102803909 [Saccoglossus kowalevskii]